MKLITTYLLSAMIVMLSGCASMNQQPNTHVGEQEKRSWQTWSDDAKIENTITLRNQRASAQLRAARIKSVSFNGIVLLLGQVPNEELKLLAEQNAQGVPGVQMVYNELQIRDNASLAEQSRDSWLTTKVKAALSADDRLQAGRIHVTTESGKVYLTGFITEDAANIAAEIAANVSGVTQVVKVFEPV